MFGPATVCLPPVILSQTYSNYNCIALLAFLTSFHTRCGIGVGVGMEFNLLAQLLSSP